MRSFGDGQDPVTDSAPDEFLEFLAQQLNERSAVSLKLLRGLMDSDGFFKPKARGSSRGMISPYFQRVRHVLMHSIVVGSVGLDTFVLGC